jgi:hypothetical protein
MWKASGDIVVPRMAQEDISMMSMGRVASRSTSILPRPSLDAHLQGQTEGYVFEGRDQGHIST